MDALPKVRAEIEAIHEAFVAWFAGTVPGDPATFEGLVARRFEPDFAMVPPGGELVEREPLLESLLGAHGSHSGIEIRIRGVQLLHDFGDHIVATYEEWQRSPQPLAPQVTGRTSTAILRRRGAEWRWVHVHETWLTGAAADDSPF